jgi:hypothetical protein
LIHEFDVEKDLATYCVIGTPYLAEMDKRVDRSKESSVEPSSSLRD